MARSMVAELDEVVVGIDTHADVHVAVAISGIAPGSGPCRCRRPRPSFEELLGWVSRLGRVEMIRALRVARR